jgi:nicotinamide riboside kinase
MKRIAITGPESTGKTTLAIALTAALGGIMIPEIARQYLHERKGSYQEEDLLEMARLQCAAEDEALDTIPRHLICDTDLLVFKIWSMEKYGNCNQWILDELHNRSYDHYLLCYPDLNWEPDDLRENPGDRHRLFNIYEGELRQLDRPFSVIRGRESQRLANALKALDIQ